MRMNQKVNRRTSSPPILRLRTTERVFLRPQFLVNSRLSRFSMFSHIRQHSFTDDNFKVPLEVTR